MSKDFIFGTIIVALFISAIIFIECATTYEDEIEVVQIKAENISSDLARKVVVKEIVFEPELKSLGEFKVTAYCSCEKCCGRWANNRPNGIVYGASGEQLIPNVSIATDPSVIPYGTTVVINGNEYVSHDCGGAIKENRIDIYMESHEQALEWGVKYLEVFVKE